MWKASFVAEVTFKQAGHPERNINFSSNKKIH